MHLGSAVAAGLQQQLRHLGITATGRLRPAAAGVSQGRGREDILRMHSWRQRPHGVPVLHLSEDQTLSTEPQLNSSVA